MQSHTSDSLVTMFSGTKSHTSNILKASDTTFSGMRNHTNGRFVRLVTISSGTKSHTSNTLETSDTIFSGMRSHTSGRLVILVAVLSGMQSHTAKVLQKLGGMTSAGTKSHTRRLSVKARCWPWPTRVELHELR